MMHIPKIPDFHTNYCRACDGTGVQYNNTTGLKQRCPETNGTGIWTAPIEINKPTWKARE